MLKTNLLISPVFFQVSTAKWEVMCCRHGWLPRKRGRRPRRKGRQGNAQDVRGGGCGRVRWIQKDGDFSNLQTAKDEERLDYLLGFLYPHGMMEWTVFEWTSKEVPWELANKTGQKRTLTAKVNMLDAIMNGLMWEPQGWQTFSVSI